MSISGAKTKTILFQDYNLLSRLVNSATWHFLYFFVSVERFIDIVIKNICKYCWNLILESVKKQHYTTSYSTIWCFSIRNLFLCYFRSTSIIMARLFSCSVVIYILVTFSIKTRNNEIILKFNSFQAKYLQLKML